MVSTAFAAVVFFIVGLYVVHARDQAVNGIETDAVVLARGKLGTGTGLTVRFVTDRGRAVTTEISEYSDAAAHPVGATMRVRYTPDDLIAFQAEDPPFSPEGILLFGSFLVVAVGFLVYAWGFAPPGHSSVRVRTRHDGVT
ncbi:DUF3592 domain-containing protein [Actinophytocola sp.]|uniref:DUF3592 domain-containing protein n=1 Tax=Actinophytocola sp. TaxID=1872138 RepID=UPI002ED4FDB5